MDCHLSQIERLKTVTAKTRRQLDNANCELRSAFDAAHKAGVKVDLLDWIEAHLSATGTAARGFGKDLLGDPGFVRNLREGRKARPQTDEQVRRHLAG